MKKILALAIATGLAFTLTGCFNPPTNNQPVPVATNSTSESKEFVVSDSTLETNINNSIEAFVPQKAFYHNAYAIVWNQTILLLGQAKTLDTKNRIEEVTKSVFGSKELVNNITVNPNFAPNLASTTNDARITTQVKASLLLTKTIPSTKIKVITQDSIVYLLCETSEEQAKIAAQIARATQGVVAVNFLTK